MKPTEKERNSFINNGTAHLNDVANFNPRSTTTKPTAMYFQKVMAKKQKID